MKVLRATALASMAVIAALGAEPARARDYNAEVTFRLFTATCMRRQGVSNDVMEWAKLVRLQPIVDPTQLATFVGAGGGKKGAAWVLPSPNDRKFTLSVRSGTGICAVWAEAGDPPTAEELFKKLVADVARPGAKITTDDDQSFTTVSGKARLLSMSIAETDGAGYKFTFMAGDKTGTFFAGAPVQISMQMLRLDAPKDAPKPKEPPAKEPASKEAPKK